MSGALSYVASISVVVFAASSMLSVGLAYRARVIIAPLRDVRDVFRALLANFVLIPLLAIGIERMVRLEPPQALGLFLLAGSAGAPFLIKLASAAGSDIALSAALLVLLVPATVVFLPFYLPIATAHPALKGLTYASSSVFALGLPLLSTLILPIVAGLALRAAAPALSIRLVPLGSRLATVSLIALIVATFGANLQPLLELVKTGAIAAGVLLTLGAFAVGYLLSRGERSAVLGLGTAQRNMAAAMVIASRDFENPEVLLMVTACSLVGLFLLFPVAWAVGKRGPHVGIPTHDPAPGAEAAPAVSSIRLAPERCRPPPDGA